MITGIVDTTVIIHYFRKHAKAVSWVDSQPARLAVTSITWLEVMEGATNKANQQRSKRILEKFDLILIADSDQRYAMTKLEKFQFSHHIGMNDCLIAAVAFRLQVPLYTHNLSDMEPMLRELAVQPYR